MRINYVLGLETRKCLNCGEDFSRHHSQMVRAKFCSYACKSKYRIKTIGQNGPKNPFWRGGKIEKVCPTCGKKFLDYVRIDGKDQRYCSRECSVVPKKKNRVSQVCLKCGKEFLTTQYRVANGEGKFCSVTCAAIGRNKENYPRGAQSTLWKGGITPENQLARGHADYIAWRKSIFSRDGYKCYICGEEKPRLNAHHIIPFSESKELRTNMENGVTLCLECHQLFHPNITLNGYRKYYGKAYDGPAFYQMAGA